MKNKNMFGIFLRKFPKQNIIFRFNNFIFVENKNIFGNIFIPSKGQWAIELYSQAARAINLHATCFESCQPKVENPKFSTAQGFTLLRVFSTFGGIYECSHKWLPK